MIRVVVQAFSPSTREGGREQYCTQSPAFTQGISHLPVNSSSPFDNFMLTASSMMLPFGNMHVFTDPHADTYMHNLKKSLQEKICPEYLPCAGYFLLTRDTAVSE